MQPTQPNPAQPLASPVDIGSVQRANKRKTAWAIACLVGPTALIVVSILLYAVLSFIFTASTSTTPSGAELFAQPSLAQTISNIILFLVGTVAMLTWLPGIVIGIILLATRQRV